MIGLDRSQGSLIELSSPAGGALLSVAVELIAQAQATAESAAWVGSTESCFYPPDVAAAGVDLRGLAVIRVSDARTAPRATARLLASGGFGLVVLDLVSFRTRPFIPMPLLIRLSGLVRTHCASLIVLTEKPEGQPSIGSLVSLRAEVRRSSSPTPEVEIHVIKDKQHRPGAIWRRALTDPIGFSAIGFSEAAGLREPSTVLRAGPAADASGLEVRVRGRGG